MKKLLLWSILFLILIPLNSGCASQPLKIEPNDVEVTIQIAPFLSLCEYRSYFGLNDLDDKYNHPDDKYSKMINNTRKLTVSWKLDPEIRAIDQYRLYYAPYIIIIPSKDEWEYADTTYTEKAFTRTLSYEIEKSVLDSYSEDDWNDIINYGLFLHAKSFDQENINIALRKRTDSSVENTVEVYFIYYDPTIKQGWAKKNNSKVE